MQKVLDEVKKWTEEIKIEFLKFKDNTATNQFLNTISKDAQAILNEVESDEKLFNDKH